MDLPTTTDEALAVAAFAEAIGPTLPGLLIQAAVRGSLAPNQTYEDLLETVIPAFRALTILAHALEVAEEHVAGTEELLQRLKVAIDRKMALEATTEAVRDPYPNPNPHTVQWTGTVADFENGQPSIVRELARESLEMMRRDAEAAEQANPFPDAIKTTKNGPNGPQIDEIEAPE